MSDLPQGRNLEQIVGSIIVDDDPDPPSPFGPIANPVDRFGHLPEGTRKWLEGLRDEDIQELKEAIKFQRSAKTVGTFGKWLVITIVSTFIGAVAFGEKVAVAWRWISGGPK
jgi:hypothetical protein